MGKIIKTLSFFLIIIVYSCSSRNDVIGTYKNKNHPSVSIKLKRNGSYEYLENEKLFNTGKWHYKDPDWIYIDFYEWKDLPDFDLIGCKKFCYAEVIYDSGELIFQPDIHSLNFKKE